MSVYESGIFDAKLRLSVGRQQPICSTVTKSFNNRDRVSDNYWIEDHLKCTNVHLNVRMFVADLLMHKTPMRRITELTPIAIITMIIVDAAATINERQPVQ